jgi:hypothetical protein
MQLETLLAHSFDVAIEAGAVQNNLNKDDRYYFIIKTAF